MDILNDLETQPIPLDEEERRHTRRLLVGVLCALLLTGLVFGGYIYLRKRHERQVAAAAEVENRKKVTKVEVLVDDAMVEGKTTILAGTIRNLSNETFSNIAVELQLRRREGGGVELRTIEAEAKELAPGATTRYSAQVATQDYTSATFLRVVGGSDRATIPFRAQPGNERPPMDAPASKTVVVGDKPRPGRKDEFINTPNNPGRVP
jgi:hypothetical protein